MQATQIRTLGARSPPPRRRLAARSRRGPGGRGRARAPAQRRQPRDARDHAPADQDRAGHGGAEDLELRRARRRRDRDAMSDGTRWVVTRKRSTVPIVKKKGTFGVGVGADSDRIWAAQGELVPRHARRDPRRRQPAGRGQGRAQEPRPGRRGRRRRRRGQEDHHRRRDPAVHRLGHPQPGDWKITGEVALTFDKSGFKQAKGKVGVAKGPFEGGIEGQGDRDGGWNVTVTGKWTPGGKTKTKEACEPDELLFPYEVRVCAGARRPGEGHAGHQVRRRHVPRSTASSTSSMRATRSTRRSRRSPISIRWPR